MNAAPETLNLADVRLNADNQGPPYERLARLRETDPVYWNPPPTDYQNPHGFVIARGFWVLTRHQDVKLVSTDPARFSSYENAAGLYDFDPVTLEFARAGLLANDPPRHTRMRKLAMAPFTLSTLRASEPEIRRLSIQIVENALDKGHVEFVFDVASRLPVYTFATLMGIPEEDHEKIFRLGNVVADIENPNADYAASAAELAAYSTWLSEQKRLRPDDSVMSRYVHGAVDGEQLSQDEINSFFHQIAIAGHETTRSTTAHFVHAMHQHPDQLALLAQDLDGLLPNAVEEVLRFRPPVLEFARTAVEDVELGGKTIAKGNNVYLSYPAANRDPDVFDDPDRFDIRRTNAKAHLSFGYGRHVCFGAALARLQLQIFLEEWYTRVGSTEILGEPVWQTSMFLNAMTRMDVAARRR